MKCPICKNELVGIGGRPEIKVLGDSFDEYVGPEVGPSLYTCVVCGSLGPSEWWAKIVVPEVRPVKCKVMSSYESETNEVASNKITEFLEDVEFVQSTQGACSGNRYISQITVWTIYYRDKEKQ